MVEAIASAGSASHTLDNINGQCYVPCNDASPLSAYSSMRYYCNGCSDFETDSCPASIGVCGHHTKLYNAYCCPWSGTYANGILPVDNLLDPEFMQVVFGRLCCEANMITTTPTPAARRLKASCTRSLDVRSPAWWQKGSNVLHQMNPLTHPVPTMCTTLLGSRFDWALTRAEYNHGKPSPTPIQAIRCCLDSIDEADVPRALFEDEYTELVLGKHPTHSGYGCAQTCLEFFEDDYYAKSVNMRELCGEKSYELSRAYFERQRDECPSSKGILVGASDRVSVAL